MLQIWEEGAGELASALVRRARQTGTDVDVIDLFGAETIQERRTPDDF